MKKVFLVSILIAISISVIAQDWKTYPYTPDGSLISFPADEGRHSEQPNEWWYTSGHLIGETSGKHYSYMLTYFYNPAHTFDGFRIFNLSDDDIGLFHYDTRALNYNVLATDSLNLEADLYLGGIERWHNIKDTENKALPFEYELYAESQYGTIDLEYDAIKPPLILADSGFLYQGNSDYTYYYSQTENTVSGTITFNGITENVSGTSWIDRQYGIFDPSTGLEYEWFSLQLSNGMDLNIYNIFTEDFEIPESLKFKFLSTYVDETTQYTTSEIDIERLEYSYTPYILNEIRCYSQKWRITSPINNIDLIISTLNPDNEVILPFRFYEGSTSISGSVNGTYVSGIGFTELLHSYQDPEIYIDETCYLDSVSTLLSWQLGNPDAGNPLKYDLEYSIDNQQSFSYLDQAITDTSYYWDTRPFSEDEIWLKVTGYSIDKTISSSDIKKLVEQTTSVENIEDQVLFKIYPNPSHGQFMVEGENIQKIEVIDLAGVSVYTSLHPYALHIIDLSSQQKGVYIIKVSSGKVSSSKKIILN